MFLTLTAGVPVLPRLPRRERPGSEERVKRVGSSDLRPMARLTYRNLYIEEQGDEYRAVVRKRVPRCGVRTERGREPAAARSVDGGTQATDPGAQADAELRREALWSNPAPDKRSGSRKNQPVQHRDSRRHADARRNTGPASLGAIAPPSTPPSRMTPRLLRRSDDSAGSLHACAHLHVSLYVRPAVTGAQWPWQFQANNSCAALRRSFPWDWRPWRCRRTLACKPAQPCRCRWL